MYKFWLERATAVRAATGATQTFAIQHVGPNLVAQGNKKGGNPLNMPSTKQQWWTTLIDWKNAADDAVVRAVSIDTTDRWSKLAKERGLDIPFLFMNDASRDQNPLKSYGTASLAKLRSVSQKYDRAQVFQRQQNGGFLLSKA
jgi:hypothetical protein